MRKIKDEPIKPCWVSLSFGGPQTIVILRGVFCSPPPPNPSQGHTEDEKPSQTGSLKCLSFLKDVGVELGLSLLWELWNLWLWSFEVYSRPSTFFPPAHDLCPFMLTKEVEAPGPLQACSPGGVACAGLSAQSWRTSLLWTVCHAHNGASCPTRLDASVQDDPDHKWQGGVFLKCLPRWGLWARPPPLVLLEVVCDRVEGHF